MIIATFVNVLMGKTAHTGGVTKVNGVAGKISKYGPSSIQISVTANSNV
jgi:hypothetical protein